MKSLSFDEKTGTFIRTEKINIGNATDVAEAKETLKTELAGIIRQVKLFKKRAEEIKEMLAALDKQSKSTTAEPVV